MRTPKSGSLSVPGEFFNGIGRKRPIGGHGGNRTDRSSRWERRPFTMAACGVDTPLCTTKARGSGYFPDIRQCCDSHGPFTAVTGVRIPVGSLDSPPIAVLLGVFDLCPASHLEPLSSSPRPSHICSKVGGVSTALAPQNMGCCLASP